MTAPLDGLLVADFSRVLATMTLAEFGATVVKVERPGAGDDIGTAIAHAEQLGLRPLLDLGADTVPQLRHPVQYTRSSTAEAAAAEAGRAQHPGARLADASRLRATAPPVRPWREGRIR